LRLHKNLNELPAFVNTALTVGTFDGVHKGHQKLIQRLNQKATTIGGQSLIITFHPHPRSVVKTEPNIQLINTIEEKVELLKKYGIQNLVIVPFNRTFSNQSPKEYIENFLIKNFNPKVIIIGYNHKFGKDRAGNIDLLKKQSEHLGFEIEEIEAHEIEDISVSSTKIRKHLLSGKIELANNLMGHNYTLCGTVVKGQQLGNKIGFPTANLNIANPNKIIPAAGIYATLVTTNNQQFKGMLYIGNRPTLLGINQSIEVNIFNFDKNIYGEQLTLQPIKKTRNDKTFSSIQEMTTAIEQDKIEVEKVLEKF